MAETDQKNDNTIVECSNKYRQFTFILVGSHHQLNVLEVTVLQHLPWIPAKNILNVNFLVQSKFQF